VKNILFLLYSLISCLAVAETDEQIIQKFIPKSYIVDSSGTKNPVGNEIIYGGEIHKRVDLDGKGTDNYLVVGYGGFGAKEPGTLLCSLVVIKVDSKNQTQMGDTVLKMPDELNGCSEIESYDFDGNKKQEVLIRRIDEKVDAAPSFFSWDGGKLVSITPTEMVQGHIQTVLDKIKLIPTNGKVLIEAISEDPSAPIQTFTLVNGQISLQDTHTLLFFADNLTKQPTIVNKTIPNGDYILTVKNVSKHNRTVRAEVYVNGVLVLKPKDFCKFPKAPIRWVKRYDDDDNDDHDEDHCKRCDPKAGVYAQIKVTGPIEIKVKIFGRKDSKLQISLDPK